MHCPSCYLLHDRKLDDNRRELIQAIRALVFATNTSAILVWSSKDILYLRVEDQSRDTVLFPQ
jgi:hypothetical protein